MSGERAPENRHRLGLPLALSAATLLAACYDTQVPLVTASNAPHPVIADGTYCETVLGTDPADPRRMIPVPTDRCLTLTWVAEAAGWHVGDNLLQADDHGVSVRVRKLGHGNDPIGLSSFFLVQAGPPPRQIALGGRAMTVASAHLMAGIVHEDMFVLIHAGLPAARAIARTQEWGIGAEDRDNGLSILSVGAPLADWADRGGARMGRELAHELHAAALPVLPPELNVIRIFVRWDVAAAQSDSPELLARIRQMLDAALFETGVFDYAFGMGLPPPRIDLAALNAPQPVLPDPPLLLDNPEQPLYEQVQYCVGMFRHAHTTSQMIAATLTLAYGQALREEDLDRAADMAFLQSEHESLGEAIVQSMSPLEGFIAELEAEAGLDRAGGARAFEAGLAEMEPLDIANTPAEFEPMLHLLGRLYGLYDRVAECSAAL